MANTANSPAYRSINPATGATNADYPHATDAEVQTAVGAADAAFSTWGALTTAERATVMRKVADLFAERKDELGALATREMGKPIVESVGEAEFSGDIIRYFADNAEKFTADQVLEDTDESRTVIQRRPIGPLLGIMPWNFPYYQIARFIAPNLMLGNTILLKHAEGVPGCAVAVQELLADAGVPEGVYQNIFASHEQASAIIEDPRIQGVSLTGSERAGAAIAAQAGAALKKAVLELGGSDPYVILSTDDARAAAHNALAVRLENTGQACNSNKRIILHEDVYDDFLAEAVAFVSDMTPADPTDINDVMEQKAYGPLSSEAAADKLVGQLGRAVEAGATIHVGGERLDRDGFYVSPAVISGIPVGSDIYYEEFFGPIVELFKVSSDEEALDLANNTQYGLGSTVFAVEEGRAEKLAAGMQAGMTGVNQSAPETEGMPFGGVKRSGYGRELGPLGMDEFVNKRLYSVKK
ncbi:aldehyde dehydrogenase family protein [Corynebacterium nuruki]|jgi:succinate-semialdehyde dehydrogenase/glutarate-semialdehyde dehydrogenase|uniref:aldehyde dehydrogenase family protein n=1 Tax=Corynebacterium nuruki TaxID=1032851 RepID=UPI0039BFCADA